MIKYHQEINALVIILYSHRDIVEINMLAIVKRHPKINASISLNYHLNTLE